MLQSLWWLSATSTSFWATVCKTVRPMLSDRCFSCLSVCDVGVLWPNGWLDQDETWHAGRPRPWPHCVRWRPSCPSSKRGPSPQFSAHVCCGQIAAWIKMSLGTEVSIGGWWRWALIGPDGVTPSQMVSVSASVNLPLHHKVQKFSSGTDSPG